MKVNEVKETREVVVRTEYVAEDGTIFYNKEECDKYEASALATVSRKLKRLNKRTICEGDIFDDAGEGEVEIFDVQSQEDLDDLEKYLRLKLVHNGWNDTEDASCGANPFTSIDGKRENYVFENVTYGHEVMIFWNYEEDWFWVYKDGSIEGMKKYIQEKIEKLIKTEERGNDNK